MMRRPVREPDMFGAVPQPRNAKPEPRALFDDILFLRRSGATVFRAGRQSHTVNGQLMPTRMLRAMAAQWRVDQKAQVSS